MQVSTIPSTTEEPLSNFAAAFNAAVASISATDSRGDGYIRAEEAKHLRAIIKETPRALMLAELSQPREVLAPFKELPSAARNAIRRAIENDSLAAMWGRERGAAHTLLTRRLWAFRWGLSDSAISKIVSKLSRRVEDFVWDAPSAIYVWLRNLALSLQGRYSREPRLEAVLSVIGVSPLNFSVAYAEGLSQQADYRTFWRDEERNITIGVVLGTDIIRTKDGCYFAECNFDSGLRSERSEMYERDPFVEGLFSYADENGYEKIVLFSNNGFGINPALVKHFEAESAHFNLDYHVYEDPRIPDWRYRSLNNPRYSRAFALPEEIENNTLVVRIKSFESGPDQLFGNKVFCARAMQEYQRLHDDKGILLAHYVPEAVSAEYGSSSPFPNVVFKITEFSHGTGVFFLKAKSSPEAQALAVHALRQHGLYEGEESIQKLGVFQRFVKPLTDEENRIYTLRTNIFLAPEGAVLLGTHRLLADRPLPKKLPDGIVEDRIPFISNAAYEGFYRMASDEDVEAANEAAYSLGRGLLWAVRYGYQTRAQS